MNSSSLEISTFGPLVEFQDLQPLHCNKDALTDFFGWILQIILAGIAFSCLIGKESHKKLINIDLLTHIPYHY